MTLNECKNFLRFPWQKYASLEDYMETLQMPEPEHREMLNAVMALPTKYRMIRICIIMRGMRQRKLQNFCRYQTNCPYKTCKRQGAIKENIEGGRMMSRKKIR